jgi:hydroxymethylbilane synthase
MLPAPGQGALAVQCRDEPEWHTWLAAIDDHAVRLATSAERAFLAGLGGGCSAPVACYGELTGGRLRLHGRILSLDASESIDVTAEREIAYEADAIAAGALLAAQALERGAAAILRVAVT